VVVLPQVSAERPATMTFLNKLGAVCLLAAGLTSRDMHGQTPATAQALVFAGLRAANAQGQINALAVAPAGDIYLLFDQKDGVRLLKVAANESTVLAQVHLGAAGDSGVGLALDSAGNVDVTGIATSGFLSATSGAAFPTATPATTNTFVAGFDANLNENFLTFAGGSKIAPSAIAASSDAIFIAGSTYASDLPVTPAAIAEQPASGSLQNGFVEKFSTDGSTLEYATYLTGAGGDTNPTSLAVDAHDDAWLVGVTTATGFPTSAALVPAMLSTPSGFLLRLTPSGDGIVFSTFIPGNGLSAVALDATGQTLLITGAVALGQFPVDTVTQPLAPTEYQVLLRVPIDGSTVQSGTLIADSSQSVVTACADGSAWVAGSFSTGDAPLLAEPALASLGNGYAVHITPAGAIDQTIRFGGLPNGNQTYASLPLLVGGLAVDAAGDLLLAGAVQPTASSDLLATETFDLPLLGGPTTAFPSSLRDAIASASTCGGSLCAGSAGYLAQVDFTAPAPALAFSVDNLPFLTLRNLGSSAANGLQLSASTGTLSTTCGRTLAAGAECDALLAGGAAGQLTASTSDGSSASVAYASYPAASPASSLVFSPKELDFGIQTSASSPALGTITVTNLGSASQSFVSGIPASPESTSLFSEAESDCALAGTGNQKVLAPGASCHITVGFAASANSLNDGFIAGEWSIGRNQGLLTGYSQAATLSVSAAEVDFGTQYLGGTLVPRYLYLSNSSTLSVSHTAAALAADAPFSVTDGCPSALPPGSVCQIGIAYQSAVAPSEDSATLLLDQGLQVLLTGATMPSQGAVGTTTSSTITLSVQSISFADAVVVTGVSSQAQAVAITNTGASAVPLALAVSGDFTQINSCGSELSAGATCAVEISFAPSQPGLREGLLTVTPDAGTATLNVSLSGEATPILTSNNGTLNLGEDPIGQPVAQFYQVTQSFDNLSVATTGPFRVTLMEDQGYGHGSPPDSAYATSGSGSCHHCWIGVQFQPAATGAQSGGVTFTSTAGGLPYSLALEGAGVATTGLIVTPSVAQFGTVPVHSSSGTIALVLTNLSSAGTAIQLSEPVPTGDFSLSIAPSRIGSCAGTLNYAASCLFQVIFTPSATGLRSGTLSLSTSIGAVSIPLSGTGVADTGIALSALSLTFANAAESSQTVSVANTGTASVQVGSPAAATPSFTASSACSTLAPGANCTIQVNYLPGAAPVTDVLSIPVSRFGSGGLSQTAIYSVTLVGGYTTTSAGLAVLPESVSYGPIDTGTEGSTRQFTLYNLSATAMTISMAMPRHFLLTTPPCAAIPANGNCTVGVEFDPLTNGDLPGTISVAGVPEDGSATQTVLAYGDGYGVGSGSLTISGGPLFGGVYNFGQVAAGQTATQVFALSNQNAAGSPPITVRRVTSPAPFLATSTCGSALAVQQSCDVTVTYAPMGQASATGSTAASDVGSLTIESDAESGPDIVTLVGQPGGGSGSSGAAASAVLTLNQGSLAFPSVSVGDASPPQTIILSNTGNTTLAVGSVNVTSDFSVQNGCQNVSVGANCSITVTSTPQSIGVHLAALQIASNASTPLEFVSLLGVGNNPPLRLSPSSLNFGPVQLGSTSSLAIQVTNTGSSAIDFTSLSATGDFKPGGSCSPGSAALPPQGSCTIVITFAPTVLGGRSGVLSIASSASTNPLLVNLAGVGAESQLVVTPLSLAFGNVVLGQSAALPLQLVNQGTLTASGLGLSTTGDFTVSTPCLTSALAPGAVCTITITFNPSAVGSQTGQLTVTSSDPASPTIIPLTGTGLPNPTFSLTVNGGTAASLSIVSGNYAVYPLLLVPSGGFSGEIALTCTPQQTSEYASCSLLPSQLSLSSVPETSSATVNTIEAAASVSPGDSLHPNVRSRSTAAFLAVALPVLLIPLSKRGRAIRRLGCALAAGIATGIFVTACGGSGSSPQYATPPGTYHFAVTASSTAGTPIRQSVTLTLVVDSP